ncbi:hypothetical protein AUJ68_06640 [Candidatus Woesearchaeota archaeon CG1_02_57_44]|nr:MAG: hypothetical protein AUJ68_06640 [Candidatus Woesearchaeota archaeon CG1_02_57_44]
MGFITRNTNMSLLATLLLVLLGVGIISVVYNARIGDINHRLSKKVLEADNLSSHLQVASTELTTLQQEIGIKQEREQSMTEQFLDVRTERDDLNNRVLGLEQDVRDLQRKVQDTQADLDVTSALLFEEQDLNKNLTLEVTKFRNLIAQKDQIITDLASQVSALQTQVQQLQNGSTT